MYRWIVSRRARRAFRLVGEGNYEEILRSVTPSIEHTYRGDNAVGGTRHSVDAMRRWFERVYRLFPKFHHEVKDVLVKGWPWNTVVAVPWTAHATCLIDGEAFEADGVHVVRFVWGRITEIQGYPDTEKYTSFCRHMAGHGMREADAPPIED